jgi:hypothetical protein
VSACNYLRPEDPVTCRTLLTAASSAPTTKRSSLKEEEAWREDLEVIMMSLGYYDSAVDLQERLAITGGQEKGSARPARWHRSCSCVKEMCCFGLSRATESDCQQPGRIWHTRSWWKPTREDCSLLYYTSVWLSRRNEYKNSHWRSNYRMVTVVECQSLRTWWSRA